MQAARRLVVLVAAVVAIVAAVAIAAPSPYPTQKQVPVIGILVSPLEECNPPPADIAAQKPNGCIESYYSRWLEASGARIVPIPWNNTASTAHLDYLLARVNGVVFPGGGLGQDDFPTYFATLSHIVDYALARNAQGDAFLTWGTCYGFQMTAAAVAKNLSVVQGGYSGMYPLMMALNFTSAQPRSKMFGTAAAPQSLLRDLATKPTTLNWHHAGIAPSTWYGNARITSTLRALSTNTEPSGLKQFISSYEAISANIFATQFHPERPPYEFSNPGIGHAPAAIGVSRYLADFVVGRAKLNNHTFENAADSEAIIVERHPLAYQGWGTETYYIFTDPTTRSGLKEAGALPQTDKRRRWLL